MEAAMQKRADEERTIVASPDPESQQCPDNCPSRSGYQGIHYYQGMPGKQRWARPRERQTRVRSRELQTEIGLRIRDELLVNHAMSLAAV